MRLSRVAIVVLCMAAVLVPCTVASADVPSTDGWTLTPVVDGSSVTFLLGIDNMAALTGYNGPVSRTWGDPTLSNPGQYMVLGNGGILEALTITVDGDPAVSLEFHYTASAAVGGDNVNFLSNIVSFAPLAPVQASATAAITVTDRDGNGATATGLFGGKMYRAMYADLPVAGWMQFADLVSGPVIAPLWASHTGEETTNPVWQTLNGPVADIQSEFRFHLTANDSASGTSNFEVRPVPEPSSVVAMLTGCIGIFGFIRRRRA